MVYVHLAGQIPCVLYVQSHLTSPTPFNETGLYLHFAKKETDYQRGQITYPRTYGYKCQAHLALGIHVFLATPHTPA